MAGPYEWDGEGSPPVRLSSPDGTSYWTAEQLPESASSSPSGVDGETIRFFPDSGVAVPLWDDGGPLEHDPAWLAEHLGLDGALVARLAAWGLAYDEPESWRGNREEWVADGRRLVEEVRARLPAGLTLVDRWHGAA